VAFALAYLLAGKMEESFARATDLLKLDPNDVAPLLLIVRIGPGLTAPTGTQVLQITNAAIKLGSITLSPPSRTPSPAVAEGISASTPPVDPETTKVLEFIGEQRKGRAFVPADPNILKRELVRSALEWAQNTKR
jgi:hypothetical protein